MFRFEIYGGTDKGLVRENNEDSIGYELYSNNDIALAVVADGVGGYEGGEIASRITVEIIKESVGKSFMLVKSGAGYSENWMQQALLGSFAEANDEIIRQQKIDKHLHRMASTVVAVLCRENNLVLSHYGDSRCYRLRNNELIQLTRDHSMAQQMLDDGILTEDNYNMSPYHHIINHAMGLEQTVVAEATEYSLEHEDVFLLCSDGLTNCLNDKKIHAVMNNYSDIQLCVDELIAQANDAGGVDNISVVVVKCKLE